MVNGDSTTVNQAMAEPYTAGDWEKTTEVEEENGEEDIHKLWSRSPGAISLTTSWRTPVSGTRPS
jgi:hypothetical protein